MRFFPPKKIKCCRIESFRKQHIPFGLSFVKIVHFFCLVFCTVVALNYRKLNNMKDLLLHRQVLSMHFCRIRSTGKSMSNFRAKILHSKDWFIQLRFVDPRGNLPTTCTKWIIPKKSISNANRNCNLCGKLIHAHFAKIRLAICIPITGSCE